MPRAVSRYAAGGISLEGDDIGGTWSGSTPAVAETCVARFPVTTTVEVFFNPSNPTESTLAPPGRVVEAILWAIAALLAAAAFAAGSVRGLISP